MKVWLLKLAVQWALGWLVSWLEAQVQQDHAVRRVVVADPSAVPTAPAPRRVVVHKVPPVDTRPGHWNRETGSFNE